MSMGPEYRLLLTKWLRGHEEAIEFIDMLFSVLHTCDDLTDRDATVSTAHMQRAFWNVLIELPRNRFYTANFALLNGSLQLAFLNWEIANQMEVTEGPNTKQIAFVLRSSYADLVTLCAWLIGGHDWSIQVGYESRVLAGNEGLDTYRDNLTREGRQPNVIGD